MIDGVAVCVAGVFVESGELVSCIGDVASCALIEEANLYDNGYVVEAMN